ncbi:MAG: hypothetical protein ACLQU1_38025 [Bryobacteraceae bacterium]
MAKALGFNDDELKLLLVAVRQMRRTFAQARKTDPGLEACAALYDDLFEKLRDMTGPLPEQVEDVL